MNTMTIVIDESQDSRSFDSGYRFFEEELEQAKNLILYLLEKSKQVEVNVGDDPREYLHQHNTITILGPRGVGKTSFLLSLREDPINKSGNKSKIIWLPTVDPTMMEKNEVFLVIVVANILKKMRKNRSGELSQKVRDKLDSLSRDLVVLAPSQVQEEQWKDLLGDPSSFAYELLAHAHSGLSLAQSFHEFLHVCLEEYGAKAFVQPIDDVDNDIEQGWPVLETLRKYLNTPYLITIVSGDIRLYQSLVRKHQVDKFGRLIKIRSLIEKTEPKIKLQTSELVDQVSQLTDQYLAKLIPPYCRIHLKPLSVKVMDAAERDEEFLILKYKSAEGNYFEKKFSEIYNNFRYDLFNIPRVGKEYSKVKKNYIEIFQKKTWLPMLLLPSATRSMVAFLKVIQPWSAEELETDKKAKISEEEEKKKKEKAIEELAQVFNNTLYNGRIQTADLLALKTGGHLEWLAEYCLDAQQELSDFWAMESLYDNEELNHQVLLLQAFLFQAWTSRRRTDNSLLHPDGPISFAIKVCFPCWIASINHLNKEESQKMKLFIDLSSTIRRTYLAVNGLSYMIEKAQQKPEPCHYAIEVKNATEVEKLAKKDKISLICRFFMFQPAIGHSSWISIFTGLARLADILREGPQRKGSEANEQLKNLIFLLTEPGMSHISTTSPGSPTERTTAFSATEPTDIEEELKLGEYLLAWVRRMRDLEDTKLVTPLVIARTFRRFTRNLEFIYRYNNPNNGTDKFGKVLVGEVLELQIIAFLNSLLIEEVISKKGILGADLRLELLTVRTRDLFNENLKRYYQQDTIPYTLAMLCCPLLLVFLKMTFREFKSPLFHEIKKKDVEIYKIYIEEDAQQFLEDSSKNLHNLSFEKPGRS